MATLTVLVRYVWRLCLLRSVQRVCVSRDGRRGWPSKGKRTNDSMDGRINEDEEWADEPTKTFRLCLLWAGVYAPGRARLIGCLPLRWTCHRGKTAVLRPFPQLAHRDGTLVSVRSSQALFSSVHYDHEVVCFTFEYDKEAPLIYFAFSFCFVRPPTLDPRRRIDAWSLVKRVYGRAPHV